MSMALPRILGLARVNRARGFLDGIFFDSDARSNMPAVSAPVVGAEASPSRRSWRGSGILAHEERPIIVMRIKYLCNGIRML